MYLELNVKASIIDNNSKLILINKSITIYGKNKEIFSLMAFSESINNLNVCGSKFELHGYLLKFGHHLTISNEFINNPVHITFDSGKLLIFTNVID